MKTPLITITIIIVIFIEQMSLRQVWKLTSITDVYPSNLVKSVISNSVKDCAEGCTNNCKCMVFRFDTVKFFCYYYSTMVSANQATETKPNQVYYWPLIELDACKTHLGYIPDKKMCYKGFHEPKQWQSASQKCASDGGHLFIADTSQKREIIGTLFPGKEIYVGARQKKDEFLWNDGRRLTEIVLEGNSVLPGSQLCVIVNKDEALKSINCDSFRHFVCEIPLVP